MRTAIVLSLLAFVFGACGAEDGPAGAVPVATARLDAQRYLGERLVVENLTVWPVYTDRPLDVGPFLTLGEAEARGTVEIREVGGGEAPANSQPNRSEQVRVIAAEDLPPQQVAQLVERQFVGGDDAVVNALVIENKGDLPLLVCAGTVVKGGKQDRQIGQDFVVEARATVRVDAFCVEPGRWSNRAGEGANDIAAFTSSGGVAPKMVRTSAQYRKDQGEVWNQVRVVLSSHAVDSATETLLACDVQADEETRESRVLYEDAVLERFRSLGATDPAPVGFAYAVDGTPVTVRAFAHERLLRGQLPAFAKAMAMEADLAERSRSPDDAAPEPATAEAVVAMVKQINTAAIEYESTQAGNWNGYRKAQGGFNGTCFLPDEEGRRSEVVVTVDWTAK